MSHRAVNWALEQRELKSGPWRVLVMLADRHNKDTLRCDPEQSRLAADCNMGRATVNRHLDELEADGFLRRVPRQDPVTKRNLSTFYILGLDFDRPPLVENALSQNETRGEEGQSENKSATHVSNRDAEPCLKNGESHVSKSAVSMSQNETLTMEKNHVREPCADGAQGFSENSESAGETRTPSDGDLAGAIAAFVGAYPKRGTKTEVVAEFEAAVREGADPDHILGAARAYAREQAGNDPKFIARPENWLRKGRWKEIEVAAPVDHDTILARRASWIIERRSYAATSITSAEGRELVEGGFVSPEQCRAAGVIL